jgi:hypothetical protein
MKPVERRLAKVWYSGGPYWWYLHALDNGVCWARIQRVSHDAYSVTVLIPGVSTQYIRKWAQPIEVPNLRAAKAIGRIHASSAYAEWLTLMNF